MDGLSNQEKKYDKNYTSFIPSHIPIRKNRSRFLRYKQSLLLMSEYKTVEDAFDCDRPRVETFELVSGF